MNKAKKICSILFKVIFLGLAIILIYMPIVVIALQSFNGSKNNEIFTEFKGSFTEQFVLTELKSNKDIPIFYWSAEKATAEIDFLIQLGTDVIPIEVKASENLQAKSLKTFIEKYKTMKNVRTSMSNYRKEEKLVNIPLYTIANIEKIIAEF